MTTNAKYDVEYKKLRDTLSKFIHQKDETKAEQILDEEKIDEILDKKDSKENNIVENESNEQSFEKDTEGKNEILENDIDGKNEILENDIDGKNEILENDTLLFSEKLKKVVLPYTKQEIEMYLEQYPDSYSSPKDVIAKEFELSSDYYMKHPTFARFRETYSLIRDRESKSVIDAFKYAISLMFHYELNPVIIAACKTQDQLEHYMDCLERNKLDEFTDFKIKFEVNPVKQ